jgi:hypothetical protein
MPGHQADDQHNHKADDPQPPATPAAEAKAAPATIPTRRVSPILNVAAYSARRPVHKPSSNNLFFILMQSPAYAERRQLAAA